MTEEDGPLLRVRGLRVSYGGSVEAVRGVDFDIRVGEVVALVGESGSGKTTIGQAVLRLNGPNARTTHGRVEFAGRDLLSCDEGELRALRGGRIALIPQDPTAMLDPLMRVGKQVAEVLRLHGIARGKAAERRAVDLLGEAGLAEPATAARRYPHQLSGGMRQRVLIAIAIAGRPELVIADEPTSALDVTVQRQVLDHLAALARRRGIAMLLITHDLGVAVERSDRTLVIRHGEIVESGPTARVLTTPTHAYARMLVADVPGLTGARLIDHGGRRATAETLLELRAVTRRYGDVRAVDGVDLTVHAGETVGLVGESGSGKSTTARMAALLDVPTDGVVAFEGTDVTGLSERRLRPLRRRVQLVRQNPFTSLDPRWTVRKIVAEPLRAFGIGDHADHGARVDELLDAVGLPAGTAERRPAELSGGQRQRVAIARALAPGPTLLVCDEPVSALDVSVQARILRLLVSLQSELGIGCLFISHDMAVVRQLCGRVAVMRAGRVVESAPAEELFADPRHDYTRALLDAVPGRSRRPSAVL